MTRAGRLLFAIILALSAGAVLGYVGRRVRERGNLPPRRTRPPALEAALRAWEKGGAGRLPSALAPLEVLVPEDDETRAEIALLRALAAGDDEALAEVAGRHPGTDAAARAWWLLGERAPARGNRDAMREAFQRAWPHAWVLTGGGRREP